MHSCAFLMGVEMNIIGVHVYSECIIMKVKIERFILTTYKLLKR